MTPQTQAHLLRAHEVLSEARKILGLTLPEAAARSAYFAAFHAAAALIGELTGKVAKRHAGVHSEFSRLTRTLPSGDKELLPFLGQSYVYKELSDYAVGSSESLTLAVADEAIRTAERFVQHVTDLIDAATRQPVSRS